MPTCAHCNYVLELNPGLCRSWSQILTMCIIRLADWMVFLACIILVCLFYLQHYGTHKVAFMFAPIVITWLLCISGIGVYNVIHHQPGVFRALSPYYMWNFFKVCGKEGWVALGGVALCITGECLSSITVIVIYQIQIESLLLSCPLGR